MRKVQKWKQEILKHVFNNSIFSTSIAKNGVIDFTWVMLGIRKYKKVFIERNCFSVSVSPLGKNESL